MYQKSHERKRKPVIITIKDLGINGEGLGYYKKKIIFIKGALPGEVVVANIVDEKPHYMTGELVRIKEKSADRVDFPEGVSPEIGGLELAHMNYDAQLKFKKNIVKEALRRYHPRDWQNYKIKSTIPAPDQWHYRAKASYQLQMQGRFMAQGLYKPESHEVVDIPTMPTQNEATQKVEREIKKLLIEGRYPIARIRQKRHGVKTVVVRQAQATGEIQVTLITTTLKINGLSYLAKKIMELPQVVSVFQNVTSFDNPLVWGEKTVKLAGKNQIMEQLLDVKFALSPRAFFQLNPVQTERLYAEALKYLNLTSDMTLIDAYCGVGTIGLIASREVKHVIGIESIPEAVEDAKHNAKLNHIRNAEFITGNVDKILPELAAAGVPMDALIVDPPRTGLGKKLIKTILQVMPKNFVYISCNPSTLAQDLVLLANKYDVRLIQNIDMLPQTPRCECIVKLVARD
ncbi:MAG: 23S rRNA (uracil(1939)-C(5))-methyltransferase RlmD [Lactobacillus sp.]|nr:23S rRNA (uracil(1939)-C(5))-methyltransferase RlmD [Lactobacillus sp.]